MKALTIWQPWASLIMAGYKPYEFRGWPAYGYVVAIASSSMRALVRSARKRSTISSRSKRPPNSAAT